MTEITKNFGVLLITTTIVTGAAAGCTADGVDDAEETVSARQENLYVAADRLWPRGSVPVCWESTPAADAQERGWVRDQVAKTWEKAAAVSFSGWGQCTAGQAGVHIQLSDERPHVVGSGRPPLDGVSNGMVLNFVFGAWKHDCATDTGGRREFCIRAIAAHEFGHALGFYHEQLRPDTPASCWRDQLGNDQPEGVTGAVMLGDWDEGSIMNYCNPRWNNDGVLSPIDIAGVRRFYPGNMNQRILRADGTVGDFIEMSQWNNGWDIAEFFSVGGASYAFILKTDDGTEKVLEVGADGRFGATVESNTWSPGWTSAQLFTTSQGTFLYVVKESDGTAKVLKVNGDGSIGALVEAYDLASGFSSSKVATVGGVPYLILVNRASGALNIHKLGANGKVGTQTFSTTLTSGYTTVEPFEVGGSSYLFFLKQGDGTMHVRRVNSDGTLGADTDSGDWNSDWTSATFFRAGGLVRLLVVKATDGTAKVLNVNAGGTIGGTVYTNTFQHGFTTVESYEVGGQPYVFLVMHG